MTETPSYPALIELISRLEGKDKKTAETALYCLNRLEKKETKLFNQVQDLRRAMHEIYEVYAGSEGDLKQAEGYYLLCLITEMSGIAAEHKK